MKMIVMRHPLAAAVAAAAVLGTLGLAGCGGSAAGGGEDSDKLDVVASFYPLEFIARTVGGDSVHVTTLTAPGVEPHDLELTPKQVGSIAEAKLVLFEKNLQPAVDDAVEQNAKDAGFDVAPAAQLEATGADFEEPEEGTGAAPAAHEQNALDPHFWLDPIRYAAVVKAVEDKLADVDSANAAGYHERAKTLLTQIGELDTEYRTGLAHCKLTTFVTSHEAFAYLAKRYGLTMIGIAGFTPDSEPTPSRIKEVQDIVKTQHVTTIFSEELVSPKVAETIAHDVGVRTAVLSPIEGLTDANSKETYLTLMRKNLQELQKANGCS
jgi:zinc transport system substrate-binding protein